MKEVIEQAIARINSDYAFYVSKLGEELRRNPVTAAQLSAAINGKVEILSLITGETYLMTIGGLAKKNENGEVALVGDFIG